jgi:hypothetical protein
MRRKRVFGRIYRKRANWLESFLSLPFFGENPPMKTKIGLETIARKKQLASNIRALLALHNLSANELADKINAIGKDLPGKTAKIDPKWLRDVARHGLAFESKRNLAKLRIIAAYFKLEPGVSLWSKSLVAQVYFKNDTTCIKLWKLLQTGKYDYLKALILRLDEAEFPKGKASR